MTADISNPIIILVDPQLGENIGAAARAMFNLGLNEMRLVKPRDGWPNQAADKNSAGALAQMQPVQVFDTLAEAIADLHYVMAATARPRDMLKPVYTPKSGIKECRTRAAEGQKIGLIFGPERMGLINDAIAKSQGVITIPTNPDFSSLNLAQSVALLAYEWLRDQGKTPDKILNPGDSFPVEQEKLEEFLTRLEEELETRRFFRTEEMRPTMKRNIRNMFTRSDLTDQEVRTLHGMLSALIEQKKPPK
ncbi:MAG: hypothetical protein DHS20C02_02600 [Micavibrio sp.]|nr:MAG: hypothetical protein DHS20C02_02600 [Micavibrio sp.]